MDIKRKIVDYVPAKIHNEDITEANSVDDSIQIESEKVIERLLEHIAVIDKYNERLKSIDYLINNAEGLAKNPTYETDDKDIIEAIKALGGNSNVIDFELFKKSIDIILENYDIMASSALTGIYL